MLEPRNAFRETFLLEMPACNREVIRKFGEVILSHALEISSAVPAYDQGYGPPKRSGLKAVLADIEYLAEYVEVISEGETDERGEAHLDEAAEETRNALHAVADKLRSVLRLKARAKRHSASHPENT